MASQSVLGIDIGIRGAIALLSEDGRLLAVWEMPCLRDGPKGRRSVQPAILADIIYSSHADRAYVERVGPRPLEGVVGAFAFGMAFGSVLGVLAACGVPATLLTPPQWKRIVGIPPGKAGAKDHARSQAIRRWPAEAARFARVKDDGKAEAALIAVAGLERYGPPKRVQALA